MKLSNPIKTTLALALACAPVNAAVVFTEDFESTVVVGYDKYPPVPGGWVAANQGFGSDRSGLYNDGAGNQTYTFRYTNSGLTSDVSGIGSLTVGATYTVDFDALVDSSNAGTPYTAQLIAFAPGAPRNDARSTPAGSIVLASSGGSAPAAVSFSYTTGDIADGAYLGYDLGLRFRGATTSADIDNVVVDITVIPEPGSLALFALSGFGLCLRRRRNR